MSPSPEPEPEPEPTTGQLWISSGMLDPLAAYRRVCEPRWRDGATRVDNTGTVSQQPPGTPTIDRLQNRAHIMKEDWGDAVQPLVGLKRAEELKYCIAVVEEDRNQLVRGAGGRMFPKRRRVLAHLTPPKDAAQKRAEAWSLGRGWGEGKLGREGLQPRREGWEAATFPNFSTMGRDVRRNQKQSIEVRTNHPIKIRQRPTDPMAGRRLPKHLKTTGRCPTPDGMVGRTTRLLRAVGPSSVGMTAEQMERRRQGHKERLAARERRRNPGPPWERGSVVVSQGSVQDRLPPLIASAETRGGRMSTEW